MKKITILITGLLALTVSAQEPTEKKPFYEDAKRGWYWHETPPVEEEEEIELPAPMPTQSEQTDGEVEKIEPFSVAHIRQSLPELRDRAIDNATDENLLAWAVMQRVMLDKGSEFAFRNRNLFMKFPELSEERLMKTSGAALIMREDEIRGNRKELFKELSKKISIFYFYRGTCNWCQKQGPLVSLFRDKTGIDALPITFDGLPPTGDFNTYRMVNELDEDFVKRLGISQVPATYMVFNDGSEITQLTDGFTTLDAMEERLILLAEDKGLIEKEQLNKVMKAKRVDFVEEELKFEPTENPDEVLRQLVRDRFGLSDSTKATTIKGNSNESRNQSDE